MTMTISDFPIAWVPLLDTVVKSTLVLVAAGLLTVALRRTSAAQRHLIWTLALISALVLPVLSLALPRWQLPILTLSSSTPASAVESPAPLPPPLRSDRTATSDTMPVTAADQAPATAASGDSVWTRVASVSWQQALAGFWAVGVLLILGRVAAGLVAVRWMARRSERVFDAPWMKMAIGLASEVGVTSNITFLRSRRAAMPMACGVLRPAVMMPVEADAWPADRLRIVLLHELAHVKRRDCLTHVLAQLACALHWFNPLAWIAARNIRLERERACDDLVLASGTRGSDYADQLLEIARVMRSARYPAVLAGASLAMAHRTQLEGRLMAILDPRVPHAGLSRLRAAAATAICCAAVVPLAALQPWSEAAAQVPVAVAPAGHTESPEAPKPAPAPAPQPAPEQASKHARSIPGEAASLAAAVADGVAKDALGGVLAGTLRAALEAVAGAQDAENQATEKNPDQKKASGSKADPRMVAALTAALKDTDKEVRETAMHALVQLRDPAVFDPLVQALKDVSSDVRGQAAFGLGQLRDRRAVEPLAGALRDEHADVREQAAFALGQLRDRSVIPALTAAMTDVNAKVREQVIFALGQIRDPAAIDGLTIAIRDASADVREQAAFALGQLRDRRAVEPLISALKDADADVREQAAFALGQIRDAGAVEALIIALKDSSASVREQAAFALGQLRDPRAIDALTTALKDPQASVRQQAAFALGQLAR